jgi:hypothetical protein
MKKSDDSRLRVRSDATKQSKFTTLRVRGNGETVYPKVYLRTNEAAAAHGRVDRFGALRVRKPNSTACATIQRATTTLEPPRRRPPRSKTAMRIRDGKGSR